MIYNTENSDLMRLVVVMSLAIQHLLTFTKPDHRRVLPLFDRIYLNGSWTRLTFLITGTRSL